MPVFNLWIVQVGALLFSLSGILTLIGLWKKKALLRQLGLYLASFLGPITLGICWKAQWQVMTTDGVLWGRLMAGDVSKIWAIGSVGLIAGTGIAVGALAIQEKAKGIILSAIAFALTWWVIYLHPTPHYVPMPAWVDKIIWFGLTVGGATTCLTIFYKYQSSLAFLQTPLIFIAGVFPLLAVLYPAAIILSQQSIDLPELEPAERIQAMGCLSCHSMGEVGYPEPGGGLESVASRKEDVVHAFLADPSPDNAKRFKIRENPTGKMAGVHLTEEDVNQLTEALKSLFEVQPPSQLGPGWDHIEAILTKQTCLSCHTLKGEGAPQGGIGGPLEQAAHFEETVLVEWLKNPSSENAVKLKIREEPMGAMLAFQLPEEQAIEVAKWLKSLGDN